MTCNKMQRDRSPAVSRIQKILSIVFCASIICGMFSPLFYNSAAGILSTEFSDIINQDGVYYEYNKSLVQTGTYEYELRLTASSHYTKNEATRTRTSSEEGHVTAEQDGYYLIEIWGGKGGEGETTTQSAGGYGGAGGYVYGQVYLEEGQTLVFTLGSNGTQTAALDDGGGENGGGAHGETGSYNIGGGGGYSAVYLFEPGEFESKYINAGGTANYNLSNIDRINNYIMIAGGGGGGGAGNSWPNKATNTPDGGIGGNILSSQSGVLSGSAYRVAGTYFAGKNGKSSGSNTTYVGKGGSSVPGNPITSVLGWYDGAQPNDWEGTYTTAAPGGAGGTGNLRGGAGGAGYCGGSGGLMTGILMASNVGGGGGGSSFIAEKVQYKGLSSDVSQRLVGENLFSSTGGAFVYTFFGDEEHESFDPSFLGNVELSGYISKYFDILSVQASNGTPSFDANTGRFSISGASIAPTPIGLTGTVLSATVKLYVKSGFMGGNDVPIFAGESQAGLNLIGHDSVFFAKQNGTDYVNIPLKFSLTTKSFMVRSGTVVELSQLYDQIPVKSGWEFDFINSIGEVEVFKEGQPQSDSQTIIEKSTYFIRYMVNPAPGGKAVIGDVNKNTAVSGYTIVDILAITDGAWDTIDLTTSKSLGYLYDEDAFAGDFKAAAGGADISRGLYYMTLTVNDLETKKIVAESGQKTVDTYTATTKNYVTTTVKSDVVNPVLRNDTSISGSVQREFIAPVDGFYMIEARGGNGGKNWQSKNSPPAPSSGGRVWGVYYLEANQKVFYNVAENGVDATQDTDGSKTRGKPGGQPGGGATNKGSHSSSSAGTGGGYSMVSTAALSITGASLSDVQTHALLLAGGGGGSGLGDGSAISAGSGIKGGNGGSRSGTGTEVTNGQVFSGSNGSDTGQSCRGTGGGATSGGTGGSTSDGRGDNGSFLVGGAAGHGYKDLVSADAAGGGGGAGYYGGGGGGWYAIATYHGGGGGGGSSFVKTDADYSALTTTVPSPSLTTSGVKIILLTDNNGNTLPTSVDGTSSNENKVDTSYDLTTDTEDGNDLEDIGYTAEISKYFDAAGALRTDTGDYVPVGITGGEGNRINIEDIGYTVHTDTKVEDTLHDMPSTESLPKSPDPPVAGSSNVTTEIYDSTTLPAKVTLTITVTNYSQTSYSAGTRSKQSISRVTTSDYRADDFALILLLTPKPEFWGGNDVPVFIPSHHEDADWTSLGPDMTVDSDMSLTKNHMPDYYLAAENSVDFANVSIHDYLTSNFTARDETIQYGDSVDLADLMNLNLAEPTGDDAWRVDFVDITFPETEVVSPPVTTTYTLSAEISPKAAPEKALVANEALPINAERYPTVYVEYTVTYNVTNMNHSDVYSVISGDSLETAVLPLKGYILEGEITVTIDGVPLSADDFEYDTKTGKLAVSADKITGNIVITGNAIPKLYTLTYDYEIYDPVSGEITLGTYSEEYMVDETIDLSWYNAFVPQTWPGYRFIWDWATTGGDPLETMPAQNWSVAGYYIPEVYNLTINYVDGGGAVLAPPHEAELIFESEYNVVSPSITGYFLRDLEQLIVSGTITENTVINVVYDQSNYQVTIIYIYGDSGTEIPGTRYSETYTMGQTDDITSPTIPGYTVESGKESVHIVMNTDSITEIVYYYPKTITVSFDDGYSTDPIISSRMVSYNNIYGYDCEEEAYGELPVPLRTGYDFLGWYDASDTLVTEESIVTNTENHTLTAKWEAQEFGITVYYQYEDGSEAKPTHTETLSVGHPYSISIPEIPDYTAAYLPDYIELSGHMPARNIILTVTYRVNTENLSVSKTVSGKFGNQLYAFEFTLSVQTQSGLAYAGNQEFSYTIIGGELTEPVTGTLSLDEDGETEFRIAHGQTIEFGGVPMDGYLQITETTDGSYDTSISDSSDPESLTNPVEAMSTQRLKMTAGRAIEFHNYRGDFPPPTGRADDNIKYMLILPGAALVAGILYILYKDSRRRRQGGFW